MGSGKLAQGHKHTKTEGDAGELVAGPSQAKKWKAVVVIPPAPASHKVVGKHRQWRGGEQSEFAKLALQLAEAYKVQQQGIQTLIRGFTALSNGLVAGSEAMWDLVAFTKGLDLESEMELEQDS